MFPGTVTRVSEGTYALAASISLKHDVIHVTDTTSTTVITTMLPPYGGFSGIAIVINRSGNNITTVTTGNVTVALTIAVDRPCVFIFSKLTGLWYPGPIS